MRLDDAVNFTTREVCAVFGVQPVLVQSWADKGWYQLPTFKRSPGQGKARELNAVEVYMLALAITLAKLGVPARKANQIAHGAVYYGETVRRAVDRTNAERAALGRAELDRSDPGVQIRINDLHRAFSHRSEADPYYIVADLGRIGVEKAIDSASIEFYKSSELRRLAQNRMQAFIAINLWDVITLLENSLGKGTERI